MDGQPPRSLPARRRRYLPWPLALATLALLLGIARCATIGQPPGGPMAPVPGRTVSLTPELPPGGLR